MARVVVSNGYVLSNQLGGLMTSPDFRAWDYASVLPNGSVTLQPAGSQPYSVNLGTITLTGTSLSISPDSTGAGAGPDISARQVSGIVESFSYLSGPAPSLGRVNVQYAITGLLVSFSDLVTAGSDPLALLLSGHDEIIGSNSYDILNGYDGNDTFTPGYSGRYPSNTYYDQIDGGNGIDTINYASETSSVFIDLTAGTARSGSEGAPTAARMISVENATGGSGNDVLIGGNFRNVLIGGAGNDVLKPERTVASSGSQDIVDGGVGNDTVSFDGLLTGVNVNLVSGFAYDAVGSANFVRVSAQLISIENATGGAGSDILTGNTGANILTGGAGNDYLFGGTGNDSLYGGAGNDVLRGDAGADVIDGGIGVDRADYTTSTVGMTVNLTTGIASDYDQLFSIENVNGSVHNDLLIGNALANVLYGNSGNDALHGLAGNDRLFGQAGADNLFGGIGTDILDGGEGNDGLFGEAGNDTLYGGNGNDYIEGGDGNDLMWGDAGNDQIVGGAGNDYALLGAGNDAFTMGAGDDRLRFDYGNGQDTIFDFGNGHDVFDFTFTDMSYAVLMANAIDTAQGAVLQLGSGSILLVGIQVAQLEATDFAFAV